MSNMKFTHLHVHSHYSLLDGLPKIDELIARVKKLEMDSVALTDHGALYGVIEFYKKAKAAGIKPIIGMEAYVARGDMREKKPNANERQYYHLTLLAKNKIGYKNLIKLTSIGHIEGFYYKPRIDKKTLSKYSDGIIALSGCITGEIARKILVGDKKGARETAIEYLNIFGKSNYYLELQHHPNINEQAKVNNELKKISREMGIPLVATNDVHYLKPEDAEAQDILMAVQTGDRIAQDDRLTLKEDDFSLRSPEEMEKLFADTPEAILNTQKIKDACTLDLALGETQLPHFEVPSGYNPKSYLEKLCREGLQKRYGKNAKFKILAEGEIRSLRFNGKASQARQNTKTVLERLKYELSIIEKTGFASYFLIVQDFVNWAKCQGIVVGPGRGSAAGSLVAYLLNITNVDPIKYNLKFERFLNPERISFPDIDLDFADHRRDEVINYIAQKYGEGHVAQIITFGTMAARAAIRDVGRALGYSYNYCDQVAKMIPFSFTLKEALDRVQELRQFYHTDPQAKKLLDSAQKLEGVARHASTHACGLVMSKGLLDEIVPRQLAHSSAGNKKDDKRQSIVTQYEMHSVEDLGLLKMDILGLKNLSIIERTLKLISQTTGEEIDIDTIPLNDKKTFALLQQAKTTGIFQLEGDGMRRYLKELRPTELEDIIAMIALFRPGPMELIPDFIARKHGKKKITYIHPKLEPILKKTYGVAVYQEQLIEIAMNLAGFSYTEADTLRKAVGKKIKNLLDEQQEKMIDGMTANGIEKTTSERIWHWFEPFAGYGFNRSHSTCYAFIGYQTAYLKANWPVQFVAALLSSEERNIDRVAFLVEEAKNMGINILPPDINESDENFTIVDLSGDTKSIRFGLGAIKNVGHNIVSEIINEREENGHFTDIHNFIERIGSKDLNKKSLESLIRSGVFDVFAERRQLIENMDGLLKYAHEQRTVKNNGQVSLFSNTPITYAPRLKETDPATLEERLRWEKELLGLYVSEHPLKEYEGRLKKITTPIKLLSSSLIGKRVTVGGIIEKIQKIVTRDGKPMLFVKIEDLTSKVEILIFPKILEKNPTVFKEGKIVLVKGTLNDRDGQIKLLCDEARELNKKWP